ncbi:MAG: hypothetical protein PHQ21_09145, partial [Firmicutes bacterium]|nr:hypothetical protein [Bacillota bacterium]
MARKRDMRLQVLLVIALLLVLSGFAARCAAAEPLPGDPDATWTRYITREYGIEAQELGGLRRAGMTWPSIAAYLETLYPHETIVMDTDDFVELASGSGITPFESIETYKRALSHQTDPSWLANLYAETGSWGRIESAFDNRKQAYSLIDQDAFVSSSAAVPPQSMGEALSPLYGVSADSFDTAIRLGMDTEDIVDTMFMVELVSEDDMEKTANFNEAVYASRQLAPELLPLRQRWPVREFPRELLPLVPPSGVQGAAARQLPTARPISSGHIPKGMSAAGAGSNSSIVDPSILYGTERVSPFKAYFEGFAERVDPSSGALVVRQTDFVLPGRAGLDFALTRVYNSGLASFDIPRTKIRGIRDRSGSTDWEVWGEKIPNAFLEKRFGIGVGWRLAFPTIEFTDGQKYLHMDDGGVYKIGGGNYDDVGYYLVDYGVQDMVFSEDKSYTSPLDGAVSMYKLRRKDGVEWLFGSDGRLLCVRDRFGNEIKFQCQAPSGGLARIVKAVDTVGRQILFTYQADQVVVTVIPGDASSASTWTYKLESAGGNHSDRMKLAAVIPPAGRAVSYEYSTDGTTFTPHVPGAGTGSPVTLDYLNLVTIHHQGEARFNKSPGHTAQSCYEYEASHKSMNSGDPSKSDPSQLGYYRVVRRFDLVPTVDLSGGQPSSVIRREGEAEFVYADWNRSTLRYGCTRIAQMAAGEAGIAPARESWQFDKKHRLITHETTGADSGENRGLEEKISISYSYLGDDDKLISKEEKTISVGSAERSENTQYIWDGVGNLLVTIDPANRRIERWYDQRYSLLTMQAEETVAPNGSKAARVQEYKLTPDKRAVKEEWAYMALPSTGGTTNYSAEIMRSDVPQGSFWTWSPSGAITNARIDIRWYNKGFWLDAAEYTIYYRESGASRWTRYASKRHQHFRRGGGTDTWNIALSSTPKRYDIKVQVRLSPIWISSASAVGPGPAWMPRNAGEISKQRFEYHSLYPWLPTKSSVLGFGSSGEESATTYKYEDGRFLFPTSIETVVRNADSASATIRTEAQYDGFGRVARYNKYTVGDPSASASHSCFTYDEIGRLLTAERPAQSQTGGYVRPTYRRAYDDQNFIVTISDELNRKTRETYDGLGRFVLAEQEEAPGLWRQVAHVQYDSLGRLARQYDAFGVEHETKYEYDAFGRIIKTHYPMELGMSDYDRTFSESWSVDAGDLPASLYLPAFPAGTGYTAGYATAVRWEKENAARKASELEHSTYRGYDVAGRLIWSAAQTGPGSSDWSAACYRYDDLDRLEASWVYIQGNTWDKTSHEYGLHFDAPTAMALPGNGNPEPRHEYRYNSRGLKVAEDPGKPYAIWFGYDELGRLKTADYRDAAAPMSSKLFYDHDGRITRAELTKSGALQNETTATYNLRGWLVDETWIIDGEPYSMSYAYDDVGNR